MHLEIAHRLLVVNIVARGNEIDSHSPRLFALLAPGTNLRFIGSKEINPSVFALWRFVGTCCQYSNWISIATQVAEFYSVNVKRRHRRWEASDYSLPAILLHLLITRNGNNITGLIRQKRFHHLNRRIQLGDSQSIVLFPLLISTAFPRSFSFVNHSSGRLHPSPKV